MFQFKIILLIFSSKENKSIRATTKRNTRVTKTRPPCTDVTVTPVPSSESPNKMTTRSQVRSSNTNLNCSLDTETINKRERQRKSQSNQRTPGSSTDYYFYLNKIVFFLKK